MNDSLIMIAIGVVLILASVLGKGFSYGMAPHRHKPQYPPTSGLRLVLLSFGLLSFITGLVKVLRK